MCVGVSFWFILHKNKCHCNNARDLTMYIFRNNHSVGNEISEGLAFRTSWDVLSSPSYSSDCPDWGEGLASGISWYICSN